MVPGVGAYSAARRSARPSSTCHTVSVMPSGSRTWVCRNSSNGTPAATSMTRPSTSRPMLYCHSVPGWNTSGRAARWSQMPARSVASAGVPHSKPAWRYSASTGWFCMNPYVSPDVWANSCQTRSSSVIGSRTGRRERAAAPHLGVGERRDVPAHRVVELEQALLVGDQRGDGRDRLGHRVDPPDRVGLDRQPGLDVALAVRRHVGELAVAGHGEQPAGQQPVVDVALEVAVEDARAGRRRSPRRPDRSRSSGSPSAHLGPSRGRATSTSAAGVTTMSRPRRWRPRHRSQDPGGVHR